MLSKSIVKYIQSLGHKKFRDEAGVFVAEGPKIINEFLNNPEVVIEQWYATPEWIRESQHLLRDNKPVEIEAQDLQRISQLATPNQVLAVVRQFRKAENQRTDQRGLILCLDAIQDPGNMGTIVRIADWFGVHHIVCGKSCADLYNPKVVQATMGSIARVAVYYEELTAWLNRQTGRRIYGAVLDGRDIRQLGKLQDGILVIGNESKGIHPDLMAKVNVRVTIPKLGEADSLNAAVATGIILSHIT